MWINLATIAIPVALALIAFLTFISNQLDIRRKASREELNELRRDTEAWQREKVGLLNEVSQLRQDNYRLYTRVDRLERRADKNGD